MYGPSFKRLAALLYLLFGAITKSSPEIALCYAWSATNACVGRGLRGLRNSRETNSSFCRVESVRGAACEMQRWDERGTRRARRDVGLVVTLNCTHFGVKNFSSYSSGDAIITTT